MKNTLKAIGTAILYFLLFLGVQFIIAIAFVIVIVVQLVLQDISSPDVMAITAKATSALLANSAAISLISGVLTLVLLYLIFGASGKRLASEVGFRRVHPRSLLLPVLLSIAMYLSITMLMSLLPIPQTLLDEYTNATSLLFGGNAIFTVIAVVIVAPIAEEVIFRGLILSRLRRGMPTLVAAIVGSALFAVAHGYLVWMLSAFLMGLVLCFVCIRYRSIAASIAVHMVFNLIGTLSGVFGDFEPSPGIMFLLLAVGLVATGLLMATIIRHTAALQAQEPSQNEESSGGPV